MPVIVAKDLYKCYPGFPPVLRGANITVEPGEMAAIMGPSGCGKSTMLHILGMLHAPDSGSLDILDVDVLKLNREQVAAFRRGNMGFVMQASNLFDHSTVFENVEFPLIYENVPPQERWERVIRALELVHLSHRVHYRSNRLSGGEQQRVAIARAMVNNPRILLADEPTGALDAGTSRLIMENFRKLCHEGGVCMIMVTHDPKMAEYCDSIYTLDEGVLHNKKHVPTPFSSQTGTNFLKPAPPLERGALVAKRFPDQDRGNALDLAKRMYGLDLLSRIYSLTHSGFMNPQGYSLPLPIRHMGFFKRLGAFKALFRRARSSNSLWSLWRSVPNPTGNGGLLRLLRAFSSGVILARWGMEDNIQFFFAANAKKASTAACVASHLLRLPFAFMVTPKDLSRFDGAWFLKAAKAAFITCPTIAVQKEFFKLLPDIPKEKVIILRDPISPELNPSGRKPRKNKTVEILAINIKSSPSGFTTLFAAAKILQKQNLDFHISIYGSTTWRERWKIWPLRKQISLAGSINTDNMEEIYNNSDILNALIPESRGGDYILPQYICEAMACGLPIVAAGLSPAMAEALHPGKNSLVAPAGDAAALAKAITQLAGNPAEAEALGKAASQDIKNLLDSEAQSKVLADRIIEACARQK